MSAPRVDARTVVRMAGGAALYGVFSWITNAMLLPSASLVSLRPAIVVPIFFGLQWGPGVGFFSGLVGNLIGDTLSGMGFFPQWDLGNGVVGAVAGLGPMLRHRRAALVSIVLAASAAAVALAVWMLGVDRPLAESLVGPDFVPAEHAGWPLGLGVLLLGLAPLLRRDSPVVDGTLLGVCAVLVGMGTAALIDVPYNRMSIEVAMLGEFVPAAVSNVVNVVVLLPPMLRAYERALVRGGRA